MNQKQKRPDHSERFQIGLQSKKLFLFLLCTRLLLGSGLFHLFLGCHIPITSFRFIFIFGEYFLYQKYTSYFFLAQEENEN